MSYNAITFVAFEVLTAANMNILAANDASFNDGTGIATGAITPAKRSGGFKAGTFQVTGNGAIAVTGVGFTPKAVIFAAVPATADTVASGANAGMGIGFASAIGTEVTAGATIRNGNGGGVDIETASAIVIDTIAGGGGSQAKSFLGDMTSYDADGFTITISSYAASGTVLYLAFG